MEALLEQLRSVLGDGGVIEGAEVTQRATSFWDARPCRARAIVRPRTTEDVSRVLALCHAAGHPLVT